MQSLEAYQALAISLGLGLLVGLQREWRDSEIAGIRTFPLISLLGTLTVLSTGGHPGWLSAAGLVTVALLMISANAAKLKAEHFGFGMTTEVAGLVMFVVGCALGLGMIGPAVVTAGVTAILLHWKDRLHGMVDSMTAKDLRAVMNLALIGLIILPLLPDQTYGPYNVLNPYSIWRMVVLIVGISMVAYVAFKLLGTKVGSILGGIFGGLISSTATTVSYARQTSGDGGEDDDSETTSLSPLAALVILIASTIVNVRVLIEIGVVAPALLKVAILPMTIMLLLMIVECFALYWPLRKQTAEAPEHDNPAQLKPAIFFGTLYAVVLFVVAASKDAFGNQALYWVAAISGLTDVDAITLSTAKMFNQQRVGADTAWRVIMIATMSNLVFKAGAVALLGSRKCFAYVAVTFAIAFAGGGALLAFWPGGQVEGVEKMMEGVGHESEQESDQQQEGEPADSSENDSEGAAKDADNGSSQTEPADEQRQDDAKVSP
ncbi:MAG: MgtC/SapB family protein [Fuerstiella sp.]